MSRDVTDKSDEFIFCPACMGLGSIKRWELEKSESELRRLREENERLKEELSALTNPSDARCMEIGMLREQREKLQAQVERLKAALEDRDRRECAKGV